MAQGDRGVLLRVGGDATLAADAAAEAVVVLDGDLAMEGQAGVVVVVGGTARLRGAQVRELVVVDGAALLSEGTTVRGAVHLVDASLREEGRVTIRGPVSRNAPLQLARGLFVFGVLFAFGAALTVLLGALLLAATAGRGVQRAGTALSHQMGATLFAALVLWVGLPVLAGGLLFTVIGIPTSIGILVFLLPAAGFVGYLTFGVWLGNVVLGRVRPRPETKYPYTAALVGTGLLLLVGAVPVLGTLTTLVAAGLGSGALALTAWRATQWGTSPNAFRTR
jgi:hypothetical protein